MGTERYDELVIGFVVEVYDALKPFEVTVPERSHMEERFDPKTGKKLAPVKVTDVEEHTEWHVDGKVFEESYDVLDFVCKKVKCMWGHLVDDGDGEFYVSVEPRCVKKSSLELEASKMAKIIEDAQRIRAEFKKRWGIDLGAPKIQTYEVWG